MVGNGVAICTSQGRSSIQLLNSRMSSEKKMEVIRMIPYLLVCYR